MTNLVGDSNDPNIAAVFGDNTDGGSGVSGRSVSGYGTSGHSQTNAGVMGISVNGLGTTGYSETNIGVVGESRDSIGVRAIAYKQTPLVAEGGGGWPVLQLKNNSSGLLIYCLNQDGSSAPFAVQSDGSIETKGYILSRKDIEASGNIAASGDVWARGVKLTSDKNAKKNFSSVNPFEILDKLSSLPIQSWSYKDDTSSERHIGPTAQDFHAAFGLNREDETRISSTDLHGVALAAIQGLNEKLKAENAELHKKLSNLEARFFS